MTNESEMTFAQHIISACFERHSLSITGKSWVHHMKNHIEDGEGEPTQEMREVLQSVALEIKKYLGELPLDEFSLLQ